MKQLGTHFQKWKTEALDEKLPYRLAEVKIEILVNTSRSAFSTPLWALWLTPLHLFKMKTGALIDTLAYRLPDVETETLGETVA